MALTATIYKATLQISDLDRDYYADHQLTLARHPSETEERLMVRLLAFGMNADENLTFTKGLCVDDEPELWLKGLRGEITLWLDVGQPDERRLRKACSRAERVGLYLYGGRGAELWWQRNAAQLQRHNNLSIWEISEGECAELTTLAQRSMQLQCTIQDGTCWLSSGDRTLQVTPRLRQPTAG